MARQAAYKNEDVKVKLLEELRAGKTRHEAAGSIMTPLKTFESWLAKDDDLVREVEAAEAIGLVTLADKPRATPKPNADRWRRSHEQAAKLAPGFLGYVLHIDNLVSSEDGSHKLSPWLVFSLGEFYESGKHEYWLRAGRGFSKSTSFTKVSLAECVFAESDTPPGEAFIYSVLSLDLTESGYKVPWFKRGLSKLPYMSEEIEIFEPKVGRAFFKFTDCHGKRVEVRCFPPTIKAMSGPTLRGGLNDELAKWVENRSDDETQQTNSATQVLSAQAGAFRTIKGKRLYNLSSAWLKQGPHFERVNKGSNEIRYVARIGEPFLDAARDGFLVVANKLSERGDHEKAARIFEYVASLTANSPNIPSWLGNPTIDPWFAFLKQDENLDDWLREYGSVSADQVIAGNAIRPELMERGRVAVRVVSREFDGRFAAIDTGESENPAALGIIERVIHEVRLGAGVRERRYQFRPHLVRHWEREPGGPPLDLRGVVLPAMARIVLAEQCVPAWWSDGYAAAAIQIVASSVGIQTIFISTSEQWADIYEPIATALAETPCPIVLNGSNISSKSDRDVIDLAVAQLGQTMKVARKDGYGVAFPRDKSRHGEGGQVVARALAHAGVGTLPPCKRASELVTFDDRYSAFR
jgi:hypothetical protein